jgi:sporulation protein YlmC with PRC-barrel domain
MNAKDLLQVEVVGAAGAHIGRVSDVVVDPKTWQVSALEVELEKSIAEEFHLQHRFGRTRIPLSVTHVQAVGDKIVLKTTKDQVFHQIASTVEAAPETQAPSPPGPV